ncbi:response regulator transcription factor [Clavibacter phaseoli]|uniref:response regulator transcription factor n=1 Tax=Clavibacter phaseoli TaxID=1734031 RepID=UPI000E66365F|nr:response regulator transcription factor [Clavibacter phaseoli]RIJ56591.1 DNA-binding response regulator [Clavibacter phaseoli]
MTDQPPRRIRLVIVDDQRLFIYGIRMLIESQPDLELVGSATDGREAVDLVTSTRPDIVLMDIRMPVMSGIEATHRITRDDPDAVEGAPDSRPRVVILTTFQQQEALFQSMRHGASSFITKDATPETLLETIRAVHAGDAAPMPLTDLVASHARASAAMQPERALAALSPREREVFLLAAKGLRNAEIAAAASISETTVKTHVSSILAKLDLRSRAQIVVHAYENRLLSS